MSIPNIIFSFILATIIGAAFHLVFGGNIRRLGLLILVSWFGFFLGHFAGVLFIISVGRIGPLFIVPAAVVCTILCIVTVVLTVPEKPSQRGSSR